MHTKLIELYKKHEGRIAQKWSNYLDLYDRYLQKYIGQQVTLLEIGIAHGGSLQLWKKYLGENATIVGIDKEQKYLFNDEKQIYTYCGDQNDYKIYDKIIAEHGQFDIIIDDGSHKTPDVTNTFNFLFPKLNDHGIYVIEDTHTAYWLEFDGSIHNEFNIVNTITKNVHDVNIRLMKDTTYNPKFPDIYGISFYDSIIFIEKEKTNNTDIIVAGTL